MSGALNSVFGGGGVLGAALNIASIAFPPLGLATSLANMITQGVGQAVNQAAQGLAQQGGMPKFLQDVIGKIVKDVIGQQTQPSQGGCDQAAQQNFGDDIKKMIEELTKSIMDKAKQIMEQAEEQNGKGPDGCGGGKGGGKAGGKGGKASAGSWLEAIAQAMGQAMGEKAAKMVTLSNKLKEISSAQSTDPNQQAQSAKEMNAVNAELQAAGQEFSMLQSAFSNAIKSIGEGMSQMARKG